MNELIYRLAFQIGLLIWFGQIFFAYREAKHLQGIQDGTITAVSATADDEIVYPIDLPFRQRQVYKSLEIIKRLADPGEQVNEVILVQTMPSAGSHALFGALSSVQMRQFYIGHTTKGVIFVELDWLGKPAGITRIPNEDILSIEYRKGLIAGIIIIKENGKKGVRYTVPVQFKNQAQSIAADFPQ